MRGGHHSPAPSPHAGLLPILGRPVWRLYRGRLIHYSYYAKDSVILGRFLRAQGRSRNSVPPDSTMPYFTDTRQQGNVICTSASIHAPHPGRDSDCQQLDLISPNNYHYIYPPQTGHFTQAVLMRSRYRRTESAHL
ncbi:hypothetical protein NDU88_002676 [Pleurodeles waltl]|uniref:Uncharacterized protein n=1 Tax=Pleurodeles waltl TaxID=8319 RepID=A0AAV7Q7P1_PLEWA|nr:hypothetical protein NDU88_002676 [Pleurodeles waltl]